jgi:hypothetical protein
MRTSRLVVAMLLLACGGSAQTGAAAPGNTPCEHQCDLGSQACEDACAADKPDERTTCLDRCGSERARCLSTCR